MKKIISGICLIYFVAFGTRALAVSSAPVVFAAPLATTATVDTNGGNITSTINIDTGALNTAFTPSFRMRSNDPAVKTLTLSAEANTTSGYQNAIFDNGTTKYIILTHTTLPPAVSSLTNIKSGSPTASDNPNAIAYVVNNPVGSSNVTNTYNTTLKNWTVLLTNSGNATDRLTVPAGLPLANTYSSDDETGSYQVRVTASYVL